MKVVPPRTMIAHSITHPDNETNANRKYRIPHRATPERQFGAAHKHPLCVAIIDQALQDISAALTYRTRQHVRDGLDAYHWLMDEDRSRWDQAIFWNAGIDPDAIRRKVIRWGKPLLNLATGSQSPFCHQCIECGTWSEGSKAMKRCPKCAYSRRLAQNRARVAAQRNADKEAKARRQQIDHAQNNAEQIAADRRYQNRLFSLLLNIHHFDMNQI